MIRERIYHRKREKGSYLCQLNNTLPPTFFSSSTAPAPNKRNNASKASWNLTIGCTRWATEALTEPSGPDRVGVVDDDVEQPGFNVVKPAHAPAATADVLPVPFVLLVFMPVIVPATIATTAPPAAAPATDSMMMLWKSNPTQSWHLGVGIQQREKDDGVRSSLSFPTDQYRHCMPLRPLMLVMLVIPTMIVPPPPMLLIPLAPPTEQIMRSGIEASGVGNDCIDVCIGESESLVMAYWVL
ncbi:hypothetical protein M378DRAFT_18109 [Amanita muscaria Koide BX008]|uniref:Uncharacterized protein n=1 Tax=Amanita muscaria (strain Koide BX008) TaxID=946122 RepID=A0A0C2WF66_AMAMK|nr:hypothetical protein M378DRAFT_18109 [Amanita muscaria Koide BX008]